MKAVILAAGEGSRLKPFTATRPKVMIPVGNKPILEYVINALQASGIIDIVMIVGYKREKIMDYFQDGHKWGVNITYLEQFQQLGTAHALKQASHIIKDHFLVINGDTVIDSSAIKEVVKASKGDATMLTVTVDKAYKYGVVDTQNDLVKGILEKPQREDAGNTVNAGVYCFSPRIFGFLDSMEISERGEYEVTDAIRAMIGDGYSVRAVHTNATWMDALYLWNLIDMNVATLSRRKAEIIGTVEEGAVIKGNVTVGENSTIMSGSYIIGPVSIGDNCEIGPDAVILPGTSIGSNCTIEPFVRISNSIIMNNVKIASFSHIASSIIGEGCSIGSSFIAEAEETRVEMDNTLMKANIGALIGDNTDAGGRVMIKPGRIVGIRCKIGAGAVVGSNIADNSKVFR
jgi:UDP-N-acetylglucosamine diphosphorylase/glucosamine-1-phosphate N-acetyltransferase